MKDITVTGIHFSSDRHNLMLHTKQNGRYFMSGENALHEVYGELMDLLNVKIDNENVIKTEECTTFEFETCKGIVCFEWIGDAYIEAV